MLLDLRAPAQAADTLERGLAAAKRIGARNEIVRCQSQLAWARSLLGAGGEALALAAGAERILSHASAPPGGAFVFGAHAHAAIARVYLDAGDPERGDALLRPLLVAAESSGWREAAATTALVLGLCTHARGELEEAGGLLARAADSADRFGIPAPAWEAHAALARLHSAADRSTEADEHVALTETIVERVSAGLGDQTLGAGLREQALLRGR